MAGTGKGGPELTKYKGQLETYRESLKRAAMENDLFRATTALQDIRKKLDDVESKTSSMNLLDRQQTALQVATSRRIITEAERWVSAGDAEAFKLEARRLDDVLGDIDVILTRTIRASVDAPASGGS